MDTVETEKKAETSTADGNASRAKETPLPVAGSAPTIRGAIRTEVTTSTDLLVAGDEFSIFVSVFNPFEVPLTLSRICTYLPTEFIDVDRERRPASLHSLLVKLSQSAAKKGVSHPLIADVLRQQEMVSSRSERSRGGIRAWARMAPSAEPAGGPAAAVEMGGSAARQASERLNQLLEKTRSLEEEIDKTTDAVPDETSDRLVSHIQEVQEALQTVGYGEKVLQPGNSTTRVFTVRTRRFMWFTPSTYRLNIEILYTIGDDKNVDTVQRTILVRASLVSIAVGALVGAIVGWIAKTPLRPDLSYAGFQEFIRLLQSLIGTIIIATMSVLFLARKRDTQPVLSVEDFWGGVVIGFLVAYTGYQVISQAAQAPSAAPSG